MIATNTGDSAGGDARGGMMRDRLQTRFLNGRDPVRALYVLPSGGFGGVESQLAAVLPQLSSWGVEVLPVVGPSSTLVTWLEDEGMREVVHSQAFELPSEGASGLRRLVSLGFAWRGARRIGDEVGRLVHERIVDVVVGAGPLGWMAASEPARQLGLPLVWWAPEVPAPADRTIGRAVAAFGKPDLLLCASDQVEAAWSSIVPAPTEVVTGAVDLNRFRRGAGDGERYRPAGCPAVVGWAGRLPEPGDPLEGFLDMAAELRRSRPDIQFLVAGDGEGRARAEGRAGARGLGDSIHFLGFVRDMRSFHAACDVLVTRGPAAGRSSQAALEAMAMQVPVVEVADADLVAALLDDASARTSLTVRNHDWVRRDFDAHRTARRTARLLHTLVAWSGTGAAPTIDVEAPRRRLELAT